MNSRINIEGLTFAEIEETHMASTTSLTERLSEISLMAIENAADMIIVRNAVIKFNSDMQSYLETNLSVKDFPRATFGLHGPALGITEGFEAAAI